MRGKFVAALRRAYVRGDLDLAGATERLRDPAHWHTFVDALFETNWIVYAETRLRRSVSGPAVPGRYTHGVAVVDHHLRSLSTATDDAFEWKDYARRESLAHDDADRHGLSPALRAAASCTWLCPHSAVVAVSPARVAPRVSRSLGASSDEQRCPRDVCRHRRSGTVRDAARRWSSGQSSLPCNWPW